MSAPTPVELLRARLGTVRQNGGGFTARCPAHEDTENSLSVTEGDDGRALVKCFAGCRVERIVTALDMTMRDLFMPNGHGPQSANGSGGRGQAKASVSGATVQPGATIAALANAKRLPSERLHADYGLYDLPNYNGAKAVGIPYLEAAGELAATRFRIALTGDRFRWKKGSTPTLYGLWRLAAIRAVGRRLPATTAAAGRTADYGLVVVSIVPKSASRHVPCAYASEGRRSGAVLPQDERTPWPSRTMLVRHGRWPVYPAASPASTRSLVAGCPRAGPA